MNESEAISFSVDAGIINRLGIELVGRVETAVSELIKNAYDADANQVIVNFINTENIGGILEIIDDGNGMNQKELENGFMKISSPSKIQNPISPIYKRLRAGKKGIGRFATHRLGNFLTIITKKENESKAIQIDIDWDKYTINQELSSISNPLKYIDVDFNKGTKLIIRNLRDAWSEAQIRRVFRYITELLQPDFLSDRSKIANVNQNAIKVASQVDGTFKVDCNYKPQDGEIINIIDEDKMVFNKAIAVVEGYIDESYDGYISIKSDRFGINDEIFEIPPNTKKSSKWRFIKNIHFKAYYFIYNRPNYYVSMTKMELGRIKELSRKLGSMRLYRNGFRVLPYGEPTNDWLRLDSKSRGQSGVNAPLGNNNFFGFVEVVEDDEFSLFEETSSREGVIENPAFEELKEFVFKGLSKTRDQVGGKLYTEKEKSRKQKRDRDWGNKSATTLLNELSEIFDKQGKKDSGTGDNNEQYDSDKEFKDRIHQIKEDIKAQLGEIAMLRVWAGLGLAIGEFTHDVKQFTASMNGHIETLDSQELDEEGVDALDNIEDTLKLLNAYLAFFDEGTSRSESRQIAPIRLEILVNKFISLISTSKVEILPPEFHGYNLYTIPMHYAELYSILFNLYSNAVKAIIRAGSKGKIKIVCGRNEDNKSVFIEFLDNGDGVEPDKRDKIFEVFYSTESNYDTNSTEFEDLTGRGLGLKLVKDILTAYRGSILVDDSPDANFVTCFRVDIPEITDEQKDKFDI